MSNYGWDDDENDKFSINQEIARNDWKTHELADDEPCCCAASALCTGDGPCDCNCCRACCTSLNSMTARYYAFEDQTAVSAHSCCNRMLRWLSCRSRRSASESDAPVADLGDDEDSCMRCSVRGASMLVLTVREIGWLLVFYLIYTFAKFSTYLWYGDVEYTATLYADSIVDFEQSVGIFHELDIQNWTVEQGELIWALIIEYTYCSGVYGTLVLFLVILWLAPHHFGFLRTWFWVASLMAVTTFSIFPVLPPRLSHYGIVDELAAVAGWNLYTSLADVYAAFPSMHVGWSFMMGSYGVYILCKDRVRWYISVPLALLCIGYPFSVWFATVSTGYHWIIDGAAGLAYITVAWFITYYMIGTVGPINISAMVARVERLRDLYAIEKGEEGRTRLVGGLMGGIGLGHRDAYLGDFDIDAPLPRRRPRFIF